MDCECVDCEYVDYDCVDHESVHCDCVDYECVDYECVDCECVDCECVDCEFVDCDCVRFECVDYECVKYELVALENEWTENVLTKSVLTMNVWTKTDADFAHGGAPTIPSSIGVWWLSWTRNQRVVAGFLPWNQRVVTELDPKIAADASDFVASSLLSFFLALKKSEVQYISCDYFFVQSSLAITSISWYLLVFMGIL